VADLINDIAIDLGWQLSDLLHVLQKQLGLMVISAAALRMVSISFASVPCTV
jgi:hypothetical protein